MRCTKELVQSDGTLIALIGRALRVEELLAGKRRKTSLAACRLP